jgi:hypothetical protein
MGNEATRQNRRTETIQHIFPTIVCYFLSILNELFTKNLKIFMINTSLDKTRSLFGRHFLS